MAGTGLTVVTEAVRFVTVACPTENQPILAASSGLQLRARLDSRLRTADS